MTQFIKVLWVEDERATAESFSMLAEMQGVQLEVAPDWETAERMLRINFREYSAIILDANCKLKKSDALPSPTFLGQASVRLARVFGEKHELIPWYVLSAGTINHYELVLDLINSEERRSLEGDWGRMQYAKDVADDASKLLEQIKCVAEKKSVNKVLIRHADVFKYLQKGSVIEDVQARNYMLKMMSALYNPDEHINFEYEGNPLRKVLEYIFRSGHKAGVLPEECISRGDKVNLGGASRFLAGLKIDLKTNEGVDFSVRFGEEGNYVFPKNEANIVKGILDFVHPESHTLENGPYIIGEDKKELFLSYVLGLAHVIRFLGKYLEEHPNREENKAMHRRVGN